MIANAEQAVEVLRHKQTGEPLPTKNVARNTKLVYYADELVGLKFHNTVIAHYTPEGVVINTRDDWTNAQDRGWFTITTWERIDSFTPARTFTNGGLRYISDDSGSGAMLFMHGTHVSANGKVTERPLDPEIEERIVNYTTNLPKKLTRFAANVVKVWAEWQEPSECCKAHDWQDERSVLHYLAHVEKNEYVPIPQLDALAQQHRAANVWGQRLRDELARSFRESLRSTLVPAAIKTVAPEFPYPQLERRRA